MRRAAILMCMAAACASGCSVRDVQARPAARPAVRVPVVEERANGTGKCPMALPETTARLSEVDFGEAITFTTTRGQLDELRRRVIATAERHNERHSCGRDLLEAASGPPAPSHDAPGEVDESATTPPSRASAEPVENGVRLVLIAIDPGQARRLRSAVLTRGEYLQLQGCDMAAPAEL